MPRVVLKPGKERSALRRHPWIFSGAIDHFPPLENGQIATVVSADGTLLGSAYFHTKNSIAGRFLSFENEDPIQALQRKIKQALLFRQTYIPEEARRLINAEGDGLPGLIVDQYKDVLVLQINTCGMERLKKQIVEELISLIHPRSIYEKSISSARKQEGLEPTQGVLYGAEVGEVEIFEHGIRYLVPIVEGQKTGLFLDQRAMRSKVLSLSRGKRVLNCFSYIGGFSLCALKGGASFVDSVDSSAKACALAEQINFDPSRHTIHCQDVFEFLKASPLNYDLVIVDPPAFAKKKTDVSSACQAYKELNRLVFKKIPAHSLVLTSSCSGFIDETLFQNLLFQAALEAGRVVQIVERHSQAWDHPIALNHPEGNYLKSFILHVYTERD